MWTGDQRPRRRRPTHPRRPRRRLLARLHLPQGINAEAAPRGSRPTAVAAAARRRWTVATRRGTTPSHRSSSGCWRSSPSTDRTRWPCTSATPTRTTCRASSGCARCCAALGTRNLFSASTVDQMPRHVSSGFMYGNSNAFVVPDIDRTDYLLMLGANPYESNGSLATAPDWPGRLEAIQARGGRIVVVDPRRTKTAAAADEHLFVRPGTDALLLCSIAQVIVAEGLVDTGDATPHLSGLDDALAAVAPFSPEVVAGATGVDAGDHSPHRTRAGGSRSCGGVRASRCAHRCVRHRCLVGHRRVERDHRQPRSARRRDVGSGRSRQAVARDGRRLRLRGGPLVEPRSRLARKRTVSCLWRCSPRRSRRMVRGESAP